MKFIIVRHGQTKENTKGIIQNPDVPLDEIGIKQIKKIAKKLRKEKIDNAYASDFKRTVETAQEILKFHPDVKLFKSPELREKNAGIFIDKPLVKQKKARIKSGLPFYEFRPFKGESLVDLQKRMVKFFNKLIQSYKKETVLIVTHNAAIKTLLLYLKNKTFKDYTAMKIDNTGMTIIEVDKKGKIKIIE